MSLIEPKLFNQPINTVPSTVDQTKRIAIGKSGSPTENVTPLVLGQVISAATTWIEPTLNSGHTRAPASPIRYRINALGQLEIAGVFFSGTSHDSIAFTIPIVPTIWAYGAMYLLFTNGGPTQAHCLINAAGEVYTASASSNWSNGSTNEFAVVIPYLNT